MKKQQGITLIALIITIIVLLILAGVSISIVVGDNGVLTQAQNAIKKSNLETAKEEVSMAWASCQADYLAILTSNANASKGTYFNKDAMDKYLGGKGTVDEFTYGTGENEETIIVYTKAENSNEVYNFKISSSGKVELGTGLAITSNTSQIIAGGTGVELKAVLTEITGTATWTATPAGKVTFSSTTGNTTTVTVATGTTEDIKIVAKITDGEEYTANYTLKPVQKISSITIAPKVIKVDEEINTNNIQITKNPATAEDLTDISFELITGSNATNTSIANIVNGKIKGLDNGVTNINVKAKGKISKTEVTGVMEVEVSDQLTIGSAYDYSVTVNNVPISKWKVFWVDDNDDNVENGYNGIFIIPADYVEKGVIGTPKANTTDPDVSIADKTGLRQSSTSSYNVLWSSAPSASQYSSIDSSLLNKYHRGYSLENKTNANAKCVTTLLNKDNWTDFVAPGSPTGTYALGAPTLEMYMQSWNKATASDTKKAILSIDETSSTGSGYKMSYKTSEEGTVSTDNYIPNSAIQATTAWDDPNSSRIKNLYYPYANNSGNAYQGCYGYWLASPSANYSHYVCIVRCGGSVSSNGYSSVNYCVRPVVYIPNSGS